MESVVKRSLIFKLSEKTKALMFDIVTYIFIALFVYTAGSKFLTIETFQKVLDHYPILSGHTVTVSYAVPIVELLTAVLLIINRTKVIGIYASLTLMSFFLIYIFYMIYSLGSNLPCSCGGIISELSWKNHIWFNSILILIAGFAIRIQKTT